MSLAALTLCSASIKGLNFQEPEVSASAAGQNQTRSTRTSDNRKHQELVASMTVLLLAPQSQGTLLRNKESYEQKKKSCALAPRENYIHVPPS